jgi:hypothetical protein
MEVPFVDDIRILPSDPTVWAKCPKCCKTGLGVHVGQYFSKAYTADKWARGQICENCETPMVELYRLKVDS